MTHSLLSTQFGFTETGIRLFGFQIYYYAIVIVAGMLIAAALSALLMKRRNMSSDFIFLLFVVCIPSAIVCSRLYYCITDGYIAEKRPFVEWIAVRDGGLSILGGVIGGVLAGLIVCLIKKVSFLRAADCVVINILLAQALGRWGNFFNGEVYGGVVTDPALQWFPFAVPITPGGTGIGAFSDPNATWHYAFFFYESVINLIGWALLFTLAWFRKKKPNGVLICLYCIWYGTVRTIMEPLRDPSFILSGTDGQIPWSQLTSLLLVGAGICGLLGLMIWNFQKEKAFIGSRTGDPCGITNYLTPYKDDVPYYSKINMFGDRYPVRPAKEERKKNKKDGGGGQVPKDRSDPPAGEARP